MAIFFSPSTPHFQSRPLRLYFGAFEKRQSCSFSFSELGTEGCAGGCQAPGSVPQILVCNQQLQSAEPSRLRTVPTGDLAFPVRAQWAPRSITASLNDSSYLSASDAGTSTELQLLQPCLINLKTPFFFLTLSIRAQSSRGRCKD